MKAQAPRWIAFSAAFGAVLVLALRGGTYDAVDRNELGILVWWLLALGFAFGLLPRRRLARPLLATLATLAVLAAWTALSLSWTDSSERTFDDLARVITYGGIVLLVASVLDRRAWRSAAAGLAAGAVAVALLATASRLFPSLFPEDPVLAFSGGTRLNYPFNYWNAVGAWGAMALAGALAWSCHARNAVVRAAFLAACPAVAASIYLSYSRAAIGGIIVGLATVIALSRSRLQALLHLIAGGAMTALVIAVIRGEPAIAKGSGTEGRLAVLLALAGGAAVCALTAVYTKQVDAKRWQVPRRVAQVATATCAVILLIATVAVGGRVADEAWDSFKDPAKTSDVSADPANRLGDLHGSRHSVWSVALDSYRDDPWKGSGSGTFEFAWNEDGRSPEFIRDAHSVYIEPLAELGLPGALAMLAVIIALGATTWIAIAKMRRQESRGAGVACAGIYAVFVVQAGVDWIWESTAVTVLPLAAVAAVSVRLVDDRVPRIPAAGRALLAIGAAAMCLLMLPGLASTSLVRDSQKEVREGRLDAALADARDAVDTAPWSASAYIQRGLVLESLGRLRAADEDFKRAARKEPRNWRPPLLRARVLAELDRPQAAVRAYERARRLRPRAAVFLPQAP